jgi:hypothetical protein
LYGVVFNSLNIALKIKEEEMMRQTAQMMIEAEERTAQYQKEIEEVRSRLISSNHSTVIMI